jgi:hypothetical protein
MRLNDSGLLECRWEKPEARSSATSCIPPYRDRHGFRPRYGSDHRDAKANADGGSSCMRKHGRKGSSEGVASIQKTKEIYSAQRLNDWKQAARRGSTYSWPESDVMREASYTKRVVSEVLVPLGQTRLLRWVRSLARRRAKRGMRRA